ncbi:MAG: ABC transporter substrate-binding protein [Promethearchaeota archaeon]
MRYSTHIILIVLLILFSSPSTITYSTVKGIEEEIKNPAKFVWDTAWVPFDADPATGVWSMGPTVTELVYERLVDFKGNQVVELEGRLATDWILSPDGLKYIFYLRQGITFHDGTPFNAYIMKYSLDRAIIIADPDGPSWMLAQAIKGGGIYMNYFNPNVSETIDYLEAGGIVVQNDYTLEINLDWPFKPFLSILSAHVASAVSPKAVIEHEPATYQPDENDDHFGMVPLDQWFPDLTDYTKLGLTIGHDPYDSGVVPGSAAGGPAAHGWMAKNAVGTGPYKLIKNIDYEILNFTKNTDWWGTFSPFAVNDIEIIHNTNDESRLLRLKGGDTDFAWIRETDADDVMYENGTSSIEGVDIYKQDYLNYHFIKINMNETLPGEYITESPDSTYDASSLLRYIWSDETASPENPFTSLLFRRAMSMVFNYETYIEFLLNGFGERLEGIIPNKMLGHHDKLIEEGYLSTYNPEAAKAFFQEVGWKGTLTVNHIADIEGFAQTYHILANELAQLDVGITLQVCPMDVNDYHAEREKMPINLIWYGCFYPDPDAAVSSFHSGYGWLAQESNYSNPVIDSLIEDAVSEVNETTREELYHQIEEDLSTDIPVIYLAQPKGFIVVRDWILRFEESGSLNPMSFAPNCEFIDKYLDNYPPLITNVYHSPTHPTTTDSVSVYATITDYSGLQSVELNYRVNNGSWYTALMDLNGEYEVNLGSFGANFFIEYYITASDNSSFHNRAINDNDSHYYSFVVTKATLSSTTEKSDNGAGFENQELLFLSMVMLTLIMIRRKRKK